MAVNFHRRLGAVREGCSPVYDQVGSAVSVPVSVYGCSTLTEVPRDVLANATLQAFVDLALSMKAGRICCVSTVECL